MISWRVDLMDYGLNSKVISSWKSVVAPAFLDFENNSNNVSIRSYTNEARNVHFTVEGKRLQIDHMNFAIISPTKDKIVLKTGEHILEYDKLYEANYSISLEELDQVFSKNKLQSEKIFKYPTAHLKVESPKKNAA